MRYLLKAALVGEIVGQRLLLRGRLYQKLAGADGGKGCSGNTRFSGCSPCIPWTLVKPLSQPPRTIFHPRHLTSELNNWVGRKCPMADELYHAPMFLLLWRSIELSVSINLYSVDPSSIARALSHSFSLLVWLDWRISNTYYGVLRSLQALSANCPRDRRWTLDCLFCGKHIFELSEVATYQGTLVSLDLSVMDVLLHLSWRTLLGCRGCSQEIR